MTAAGAVLAVAVLARGVPALAAERAPVPTATATGGPADGVLARVQAAEDRIRDVSLKFRQVTLLKGTGDTQATTGQLALLRAPERFRVRFTSPAEQVALYDGAFLWLWLPEVGQAFRQKATAEDLGRILGINPAEPVRSFRRGYRARPGTCDGTGCTLDFVREGAQPMTWHVRVSATDWRMEEAWFENEEVKVTLSCYDYRVNTGLTGRDFRLKLPRDAEVQDGIPMMFGRGAP